MNSIPFALPPLTPSFNVLSTDLLAEGIRLSRLSPRKRIILPIHKSAAASMHRMFNFIQPGSYIRPHCHLPSMKSESIIVLQGTIQFLTFSENGTIINSTTIGDGTDNFGVDIEPTVYHSFYALAEDTVIFETKPGPYVKETDKLFAEWAPAEGTEEARVYLKKLAT